MCAPSGELARGFGESLDWWALEGGSLHINEDPSKENVHADSSLENEEHFLDE